MARSRKIADSAREERAEKKAGTDSPREERAERMTTGRAADRATANLVKKTKSGQGTLTYTPRNKRSAR